MKFHIHALKIKCAECQCAPQDCLELDESQRCDYCTKPTCCCIVIHASKTIRNPLSLANSRVVDDCCSRDARKDKEMNEQSLMKRSSNLVQFFRNVKSLYAAALGIEILCIAAAELGENSSLYLGFNHIGIPIAYAVGYGLASFTTFATILGRYKYGNTTHKIDSCCSVLEQDESKGLISNLVITFKNFTSGLKKIKDLRGQPNLKYILKSSLTILVTAETACIITAETVDLIFFKQALYLSIPLALLAGAFAVVAPEAYRMLKRERQLKI